MKLYSDGQKRRTKACVQAICSKVYEWKDEIPVDFNLNENVWWSSSKSRDIGTGIIIREHPHDTNLFTLGAKEEYSDYKMRVLLDLIENWSRYYQIILDHRNGDKRVNEILDNFLESL